MNQPELGSDHVTETKRTFTVLTGFLSKPEKILFWFVLGYFVVELMLAIQLQLENDFVAVAGWNPINAITRPSLLLVAAICLLLDRPPASAVAVLLAISIVYPNLYLAFLGIAQGHGIEPFSVKSFSIWFETIGKRQIVNTALALVIMIIGAAKVIAFLRWRSQVSASEVVERPLKMPWTKFRIGILGVVDGALYSATMLLLIWQWRVSAGGRNTIESAISGDYVNLVSNERWIPIVLIWLVAFTSASLVVDFFWQTRSHQILFWVAVGVIAVASWNAFGLLGTWLDKQAGDTMSYARVTSPHNPLLGPVSLAVVVLVNFIYGYVVRACSRKWEQAYNVDGVDLRPAP